MYVVFARGHAHSQGGYCSAAWAAASWQVRAAPGRGCDVGAGPGTGQSALCSAAHVHSTAPHPCPPLLPPRRLGGAGGDALRPGSSRRAVPAPADRFPTPAGRLPFTLLLPLLLRASQPRRNHQPDAQPRPGRATTAAPVSQPFTVRHASPCRRPAVPAVLCAAVLLSPAARQKRCLLPLLLATPLPLHALGLMASLAGAPASARPNAVRDVLRCPAPGPCTWPS